MPDDESLSKTLSYILRHRPDAYGLTLDEAGWVDTTRLLAALSARGQVVTRADLERVVTQSEKQRFALSEDGSRVRANQGHSRPVELGLAPEVPPERLYHGTVARFVPSIRASGLLKRSRQHVHLSESRETAVSVGSRRGEAVILEVHARAMHEAGHAFMRSPNGVWLTEHVPPVYLRFP